MNALELLKRDHKEASGLMDQLETADKGDRSAKGVFMQLKQALTLHTQMEEQLLYPALRDHEETSDMVEESFREHEEVDKILDQMMTIETVDNSFMNKLTELREAIEHHVEEEENEMFPKAENVLGQSRLQEMGRQMEQMKQGMSATATNKRM